MAYDLIASGTVPGSTPVNSIDITSISQSYTDLRIVLEWYYSASTSAMYPPGITISNSTDLAWYSASFNSANTGNTLPNYTANSSGSIAGQLGAISADIYFPVSLTVDYPNYSGNYGSNAWSIMSTRFNKNLGYNTSAAQLGMGCCFYNGVMSFATSVKFTLSTNSFAVGAKYSVYGIS
jgi:hypothetical protein